ncbi:MAG: iron-sulfur cluster assembly scaffold protein [Gammaproteobacteria bacterium]
MQAEKCVAAPDGFGALARDHFTHPRNRGSLRAETGGIVRSGEAGSVAAGAFVRFHLRITDGRIAAARYEVMGEPALIAAASYLSELLSGHPAESGAIPAGLTLAETLDLPRAEHGAALLAEDAVRACFESRENRNIANPEEI